VTRAGDDAERSDEQERRMTTVQPRLVIVDGVPMSALVAEAPNPRAVIVAIHGGGTTAMYFDCPGHAELSLLRTGAQNGYTVVALDRPGYGSSAAYPDAVALPEQRVRLAYGAVDRVLGERPRGAGLFLMAHSGGCELALRMAAEGSAEQRSDLLGVELAGTGRRYHPAAREILRATTLEHRPSGMRELLWHPTELYPPEVLSGATIYHGAPPYETQMVSNWARQDFPAIAPGVRIPVQFSVAEHEKIWLSDEPALAEIASLFSNAASFQVNEQPGAGHNISIGHTAAAYHSTVFSFFDSCVCAQTPGPQADLGAQ
jgi:pimeloyl-ACP methyl ester carboxylesterase